MVDRILRFCIQNRTIVVVAALFMVVLGILAWPRVTLDAVPDITTNQVVVSTDPGGLSPEEVEKLVTFPVETALAGTPGVENVRSLSQFGLSQVTATFTDAVDVYFARQLVSERLSGIAQDLPPGVGIPKMGPVSTGLGDIYMYVLESDQRSLTDLRELQDWVVAPQLRTVPGVAEVNVTDGRIKQFQVVVRPDALAARGISVLDVVRALQANNQNAGGGVIEQHGERIQIRSLGLATSLSDIGEIVINNTNGIATLVRDVADVQTGVPTITGLSTKDGREAMVVIVMMLKNANGQTVANAIDERIQEIKTQLPTDVTLTTTYNRAEFVDQVLHTVEESLLMGAALVVVVLLLLLGNIRGAIIAAVTIPLAMVVAILGMERLKISGNLLSLGAVDFGIIVDGAVIMVENCVRRLNEARQRLGRALTREEHLETITRATAEVRKVTQFGELIVIATFIPILALEGTEGKMFRPMAMVFILALVGALVLSLTVVPALCAIFLSRDTREAKNPLMDGLNRLYRPVLDFALKAKTFVIAGAATLLAVCLILFPRLGSEFIPQLDEGSLVIQPTRLRTVDEETTLRLVTAYEKKVLEVPEVQTVFSRTGTPEVATDPMPLSITDSFVILKPRDEWRPGLTKPQLVAELEEKISEIPGQGYNFTQPIQLRFAELVSGVKADIGVKVFGEDLALLKSKAEEVAAVLRDIPGAEDVEVEQVDNVPVLQIDLDRAALARFGLSVEEVQTLVSVALGGEAVGQIVEGERRFDLNVLLPKEVRNDPAAIRQILLTTPGGGSVPLSSVAHIDTVSAPAQISREDAKRRVVVQLNVRGRDLGSFVEEAQSAVAAQVDLPEGNYIQWGGQFENLQRASQRLTLVVPAVLTLILVLLYVTFGSLRQALVIFSGVPLAVTGGILALAARGLPFSVSAAVGFIALSGVAVLNGVVMVSAINRFRRHGLSLQEAVQKGAEERLRPVLMTALVAALGFAPMALNTGIGAEVQRPLATVVIGGIASAALLTLVVLPALLVVVGGPVPQKSGPEDP